MINSFLMSHFQCCNFYGLKNNNLVLKKEEENDVRKKIIGKKTQQILEGKKKKLVLERAHVEKNFCFFKHIRNQLYF